MRSPRGPEDSRLHPARRGLALGKKPQRSYAKALAENPHAAAAAFEKAASGGAPAPSAPPKRSGGKAAKGCGATGGQAADCPNMSVMGGLLLLAGLSESPEL